MGIVTHETELYDPIIEGARSIYMLLHRVNDSGNSKQPFDIAGIIYGGSGIGMEVKRVQKHFSDDSPIPFHLLETHQENWIKSYSTMQAMAIIAIYSNSEDTIILYILPTVRRDHHLMDMKLSDCKKIVGRLEGKKKDFKIIFERVEHTHLVEK